MSKTDLQLPDALAARLDALAEKSGITPHDFIVQTIAETVTLAELHNDFSDEADQRYADFLRTGESIAWEDMQNYMERRLNGEVPELPAAKKSGGLP